MCFCNGRDVFLCPNLVAKEKDVMSEIKARKKAKRKEEKAEESFHADRPRNAALKQRELMKTVNKPAATDKNGSTKQEKKVCLVTEIQKLLWKVVALFIYMNTNPNTLFQGYSQ